MLKPLPLLQLDNGLGVVDLLGLENCHVYDYLGQ
jgi:hypothetical protein